MKDRNKNFIEFLRIINKRQTKDHHSNYYKIIITIYLAMHHLITYKMNVWKVASNPNRCFIWNKIII